MRYPVGFLTPCFLKEMAADIFLFSATPWATQQCQWFVWVAAILPACNVRDPVTSSIFWKMFSWKSLGLKHREDVWGRGGKTPPFRDLDVVTCTMWVVNVQKVPQNCMAEPLTVGLSLTHSLTHSLTVTNFRPSTDLDTRALGPSWSSWIQSASWNPSTFRSSNRFLSCGFSN